MKWIGVGIFSESGKTMIVHHENGKPVRFGSLTQAEAYIAAKRLGVHASPIEVYED